MSERLHVLTACTRPQNLARLAQSIALAACDPWEIRWHIAFDFEKRHVGGQVLKNELLDSIAEGWVCVLDDDTVMHPDLLRVARYHTEGKAVVVSQARRDGRLLPAGRGQLRVGYVDIGQALIRREAIGVARIPDHYEGDGMFLESLLGDGEKVAFLPDILSWHNALT